MTSPFQRPSRTMLRPDLDLLHSILDKHQAHVTPLKHGLIGVQSGDELLDLREQGNDSAERIIRSMIYAAMTVESSSRAGQVYNYMIKDENGKKHARPRHSGIREKDENGKPLKYFQDKLWEELNRAEHLEWLRERIQNRSGLDVTIQAHMNIQEAWNDFPQAQTALEVCHLAGINPDELEVI